MDKISSEIFNELKSCLGVIFDFDGTIVQSNNIKRDGFLLTIERTNFSKNHPDSISLINEILSQPNKGGTRVEVFAKLTETLKAPEYKQLLIETYAAICQEKILTAAEVNGAKCFLSELQKHNKKVFLCSLTPQNALQSLINKLGMSHYFTEVLGTPKTKEVNILQLMHSHKIPPERLILFGDGESDRKAALHHEIFFVALKNEYNDFNQEVPNKISDYSCFLKSNQLCYDK
ncbi:HAD family hydrolase [Kiloniella sp. EL199]|uniref:HAD family hydrolase n=1 Tax=Kiloniella sp. EL199 TaxID=2107581 RepID=UPI000EA33513|nr:HAD hydrolase-like protein [Kiloniella sp. EL199]